MASAEAVDVPETTQRVASEEKAAESTAKETGAAEGTAEAVSAKEVQMGESAVPNGSAPVEVQEEPAPPAYSAALAERSSAPSQISLPTGMPAAENGSDQPGQVSAVPSGIAPAPSTEAPQEISTQQDDQEGSTALEPRDLEAEAPQAETSAAAEVAPVPTAMEGLADTYASPSAAEQQLGSEKAPEAPSADIDASGSAVVASETVPNENAVQDQDQQQNKQQQQQGQEQRPDKEDGEEDEVDLVAEFVKRLYAEENEAKIEAYK